MIDPAMTRKKHEKPTHSHVTQNTGLHELVSAEIGQGGAPVFYGITCTRVWTLCTPRLAGQTAADLSPGSQEGAHRDEKLWKLLQVMSSPQPQDMNRYKTHNTHRNQPGRRPDDPTSQQAEGSLARALIPPTTQLHRPPRRQAPPAASVRGTRGGSMSTH
jgi:hypothetical protein